MIVDFHNHFYPPEYLAAVQEGPSNVRVTFDRAIQCSRQTTLDNPNDAFIYALPADQLIVELKYNDKVPRMLLERFNALGMQQETFSKFAISVERTHDEILGHKFLA